MSVIGLMGALAHRWRCCSPPPDHSPSSFSITSSLELLIKYKTSVFRSSSHDLPTNNACFLQSTKQARKANTSQHAPAMVPHPATVGRRAAFTDASSLTCLCQGLRRLAVVNMASLQAPSGPRVIETAILRVRQRLNCIRNDNAPTPRFQEFFVTFI